MPYLQRITRTAAEQHVTPTMDGFVADAVTEAVLAYLRDRDTERRHANLNDVLRYSRLLEDLEPSVSGLHGRR